MTVKTSTARPIQVVAGVQPSTDWTGAATQHYTFTKAIRFVLGIPEKIGGWLLQSFDYNEVISGVVRSVFTEYISGKLYTVLGTNTRLYSLIGSRLTNITPLVTTPTAAANSIATHYATLSNNPLSVVSGSAIVTVTDSEAVLLKPNDTVTLSGATDTGGILAATLNDSHIVRTVSSGSYTINVGVNASSTATGGGASVVRSSGLITITDAAHGQLDGDRVLLSDAVDTGGILAAQINDEFIIRNVTTNTFDVMTGGTASSSVSGGGGASFEYYIQIPEGLVNETNTTGYGAGLYGAGLYGTALTSSTSRSFPRTWFCDRYGNTVIATAGNQTGLYQWLGDTATAPQLVQNAPTAINYAFVSNGMIVTFGATNENGIETSDINDITEWTSSSTNQVFIDDIEGAGRLTSHCPTKDLNLIFTENKTFTFRYIGAPNVWEIQPLDDTIGIIAPMARVSVRGVAYWFSLNNFHMYRGGKTEIIPSNTDAQCTALRYVFDDLNWGQKSKIFGWYNPVFDEVWFHYPSAGSNECDRVIRVELKSYTWSIDVMDRTAAEYPSVKTPNPYLANQTSLYKHELGNDDDLSPLSFQLTGNKVYNGVTTANMVNIIPDSEQSGDISFTVTGYRYPQSVTPSYEVTNTISSSTEFVPITLNGRYYQYDWSGSVLGQNWAMGQWFEESQAGARH